jgi:hypothetical protein
MMIYIICPDSAQPFFIRVFHFAGRIQVSSSSISSHTFPHILLCIVFFINIKFSTCILYKKKLFFIDAKIEIAWDQMGSMDNQTSQGERTTKKPSVKNFVALFLFAILYLL